MTERARREAKTRVALGGFDREDSGRAFGQPSQRASTPPPAAPPSPATRELERALLARGRQVVERLRATPGVDPDGPFDPSDPRSGPWQGLLQRMLAGRATRAGLSVGALASAVGSTWGASISGPSGSAVGTGPAADTEPGVYGGPTPDLDPVLVLLVNRLTGAFEESEYALAEALGFSGYLEHHLDHTSIPDPEPQAFMDGDPTVTPTGDPTRGYLHNVAHDPAAVLSSMLETSNLFWSDLLQGTTLYRGILTARKLHDRMVEFWTDHFNIYIKVPMEGYQKPVDDREVVREFALTDFPSILTASVHSPAMLVYLNQWTSSFTAPNENYARELLELHTLGEGNGYDENDVVEVAHVLCGWSLDAAGLYTFDATLHDPAAPATTILPGDAVPIPIPAGGEAQGDALIAGLGLHPRTADFIASKLCRFLYAEEPPSALVATVAAEFLATGGDIKAMVRKILTPATLADLLAASPTTLKVKRPAQLAVTFLRQCRGGPVWPPFLADPLKPLRNKLSGLGNVPFWRDTPDGYPDFESAWISDLLGRWELVDSLTRNEVEHIQVDLNDLTSILGGYPVADIGSRMNAALAGGQLSSQEQFWIQAYADIGAALLALGEVTTEELVREIFAVTASAPGYQYY